MPYTPVNSATTLSLFSSPGQSLALFNSNSPAIFTDGAFSIFSNSSSSVVSGSSENLNFSPFNTLGNLSAATLSLPTSTSVLPEELNLKVTSPTSYAFFGSFTNSVTVAINEILNSYPFCILISPSNGNSVFNYSASFNNFTNQRTSTFQIPISAITANQGGIVLNSGSSLSNNISLITSYSGYSIQMSGISASASTTNLNITNYTFTSDTNGNQCMFFTTDGWLDYITGTTTTLPLFIQPSNQNIGVYNLNLSRLEYNLLYVGQFIVPNAEIAYSSSTQTFTWPRTIDKFSPDASGIPFQLYTQNILAAANNIDLYGNSNVLLKYAVPSNLVDNDSPNQIFQNIIAAYADQFDNLKNYIDGISYAHSITYSGEESVPDKFLYKFSDLFGWKLSNSFQNTNFIDYVLGDSDLTNNNGSGYNNTYSYYNIEIWKRILINLPWIYQHKGTRVAIEFVYSLLGAPSGMLEFNEHTYTIPQITSGSTYSVASDGYINTQSSQYIFQEGGPGRGNGMLYINQWAPEFKLIQNIDNIKTYVGDPIIGTRNTLNVKNIDVALSVAQAIETDVFQFYQANPTGTSWNWGTTGIPFSALTAPAFELSVDPNVVAPLPAISGMSVSSWLTNVYMNSINPRNRKTLGWPYAHNGDYQQLKNAYLNYYYWQYIPSNQLTPLKLQPFLNLLERNFESYIEQQLLPATAILGDQGSVIRNDLFHTQRFVYPIGIEAGSTFQLGLPLSTNSNITPLTISNVINGFKQATITPATINGVYNKTISPSITAVQNSATFISTLSSTLSSFNVASAVFSASTYP